MVPTFPAQQYLTVLLNGLTGVYILGKVMETVIDLTNLLGSVQCHHQQAGEKWNPGENVRDCHHTVIFVIFVIFVFCKLRKMFYFDYCFKRRLLNMKEI